TLGGQTALNLTVELAEAGLLSRVGVELIGADVDSIRRAEDRLAFRAAVTAVGVPVPESRVVSSTSDLDSVSFPAVVRPANTMGSVRQPVCAHSQSELRP